MINSSAIFNASILIVDDQQVNIRLLEQMLRGTGYHLIASTTDSNEVWALHHKHHYDLILLDIEMSGVARSGFQVMEELREIELADYLPVIVISAHPDHRLRALQTGARDFISKPFELPEALARIRSMLEVRLLYAQKNQHIESLEQKLMALETHEPMPALADEVKHRAGLFALMGEAPIATAHRRVPRASRTYTLLHIEDKQESRRLVEQIIDRIPDIRLLSAADGNHGIELARTSIPDVILMDINLPDTNGFEALRILHADPATAHIPIIAISANAMPRVIERAMKAGFLSYITKPIKIDEFVDALDRALEHAQQKEQTP